MFLPARIREDLGPSVYVTKSLDEACLSGYTPERFQAIRERLNELSSTDRAVRAMRREILGEAILCDVDGQGRISVSDELWSQAGISPGDEVYVIFLFDKFEIWPARVYDAQRAERAAQLSEDLSRYDIPGL